jgi:uncharacterized protein YndB with AHSA1/START domain
VATIRHTARIDRSPDDVWKLVSDPASITQWGPGVDGCTSDGTTRTVKMGGMELIEAIVTNDDDLRRFQYAITGGPMVPEYHLGTIDVLPDGDGTLVVYSTEVKPDEAKPMIDPAIESLTNALKAYLEK